MFRSVYEKTISAIVYSKRKKRVQALSVLLEMRVPDQRPCEFNWYGMVTTERTHLQRFIDMSLKGAGSAVSQLRDTKEFASETILVLI
jgi:hypothetical protein